MIITERNSLVNLYPQIVSEWNYQKNIGLNPNNFSYGSEKIVWWKCKKCGDEWLAPIYYRTTKKSNGCRRCNSLAIKNPELICEIHSNKNKGFNPLFANYGQATKICWKCKICSYEWWASLSSRTTPSRKTGCPKCKRKRTNCKNSLYYLNRKLSSEWNFVKNKGLTPKDFTANSHKKVWWKCKKCEYEWQESINKRNITKNSCFRCRSLMLKNPVLSLEWDSDRNGSLTPLNVSAHSKIKIWWKCKQCKNVWRASVDGRNSGHGCPNRHKVILSDGSKCDSLLEAYVYLRFQNNKIVFKHNGYYGIALGKRRYDFYLPKYNRYVEVTSFSKKNLRISWITYLRNIVKKKRYVKNILHANFEFINRSLTKKEIDFVKSNSKKIFHN